ncbi:hypothetical protein PtrSN002B_007471 [Pyrenophora tritici-repentis]|uniref:Gfd2/YDR514C-like C-terminal domain-containing protein n=2 Tax=Pyrenophora tritici-repentis TaxID=45151 RepID=A0A2W1FLH1_9PLEO|nr:uncharacterized protein PTRG_06479 [Pyrenophora tritici-repentis Pt-1C-BFP]KAA8613561.1 hypothetical protein PtrV1_12469 [Pyrenophora tritici-repentis]EDU49399.1 predicted protein [Pyrenophora tritici-repentis Pt-1C-BFP]KAF7445271.1 hypothetical protein A1F99_102570 [Pyrenophora tritici-repentis]KAF7565536.1 hypothetical protein PtrM4_049700 [Pyrenophora tritici-repentis]KAG9380336.1 hypothetical protein A1F94_009231 [Pyrenophora tritici-repentis]
MPAKLESMMGQLLSRMLWGRESTGRTEPPEPPTESTKPGVHRQHLGHVSNFFSTLSQTEILEYCLGYDKPNAPKLAEQVILIALKCHSLDKQPYPLLEIGIHYLPRHVAKKELANPGPHSLNLLRRIAYYHIILEENARHANRLSDPRDAEINRFGATRFVNMDDARIVLGQMFRTVTMIESPAGSKSCVPSLCPVVILNYDVPQVPALQLAFEFDYSIAQSMVATINTKRINCELNCPWRSAEIPLSQLTQDLKIESPDKQSAADQAAYALIDAIQLVMRWKIPRAKESIRSVINTTMLYSQSDVPWWGEKDLCTVCGEHGHKRQKCHWVQQRMVECWECTSARRLCVGHIHTPEMCPHFSVEY